MLMAQSKMLVIKAYRYDSRNPTKICSSVFSACCCDSALFQQSISIAAKQMSACFRMAKEIYKPIQPKHNTN